MHTTLRRHQRGGALKYFGDPAPVRRFLPDLMDRVLKGKIKPGKVFDLKLPLAEVAEGYRAMDEQHPERNH